MMNINVNTINLKIDFDNTLVKFNTIKSENLTLIEQNAELDSQIKTHQKKPT